MRPITYVLHLITDALDILRGCRIVLAAGWRLFMAGLSRVFPWVLAAELTQVFRFSDASNDTSNMDMMFNGFFNNLGWSLLMGLIQAMLYTIAVLRLAELADEPVLGKYSSNTLRGLFPVFIGYLIYSLIVMFGLTVTFIVFM